jgi:phytoene dehydrogenase-like protein
MDGAALSPKQSVLDRPGIAVPGIENLFLAGDCVAAPGASGEIALGSGIEASLKVAQFLGGRLL